MKTQLFVFIAGGSGSGKSSLAARLEKTLRKQNVSVSSISLDNFYNEVPVGMDVMEFRLNTDFCALNSIDCTLLTEQLTNLTQGQPAITPIYNMILSKRIGTQTIESCEVLIIDGMFSINFANQISKLNPFQKITIFVGGDSLFSLKSQRTKRDLEERGLTKQQIKHQERYLTNGFFKHLCRQQLTENCTLYVSNNPHEQTTQEHPLDKSANEISALCLEKLAYLANYQQQQAKL